MTILIAFHRDHYRNFKSYYLDRVAEYWSDAFAIYPVISTLSSRFLFASISNIAADAFQICIGPLLNLVYLNPRKHLN
jgi:hypothetical protein